MPKKENKYGNKKMQVQEQETLHSMELALDTFYNTLEPFEEYIGKIGYYSDWNDRRQIYRKTISDSNDTADGFEDNFLTNLFIFKTQIRKKQPLFREKLQQEFYKWVDATRIDSNCPNRLKHFLFEINEVLEGRGDNIVNQTRGLIKDQELTPQEALSMFGQLQNPLNRNREREEVLAGKKWDYDLKNEERIKGVAEKGKEVLDQIFQGFAPGHVNFDLYSEQKKLRGIQDQRQDDEMDEFNENPQQSRMESIKQNIKDWNIEKVITSKGYFGRPVKEEVMLIHREAKVDYDRLGGLIKDPSKMYYPVEFSKSEQNEIEQAINNYQVSQIRQHSNEWGIDKLKQFRGDRHQPEKWEWALVHQSANLAYNNQGYLEDVGKIYFAGSYHFEELARPQVKRIETQNQQLVHEGKSQQNFHKLEVDQQSFSQNSNNKPNSLGKTPFIILTIGSVVLLGMIAYKVKKNKIKK